ncbi:MAG: general stress protein, partial [Arthrobacter sp.]|uniref:general stress protein n=1 Tax=Arthrobacter sp. TaxID=1667 RepID=UPI0034793E71
MSNPFGAAPANDSTLSLPRGEVLGRYQSYLDAQKVVDYLADNDFPVANVSIIGNDLKSVERVTAKLSYPKVALAGAAQGAMFGVFVGLLLSLFTPTGGIAQILSAVGLGMAIWMIVGVVSYSFRKGKRDFASSSQVMAGYYDVVVAFEHAAAARQMASSLPMSGVEAQRATPSRGGQAPTAPQAPAGAEPPAAQHAASDGAEQTRGSGFNDLPDGRPQFGIRVDAGTTPPESGQALGADAQVDA